MKTFFNKNLFGFALIVVVTTGLSAQDMHHPPPPPMVPDSTQIIQMVNEMASALSLSTTQKVKITDLYFAHFEDMKTLMRQRESDRENHHKIMEAKRTEFENRVKAVLTKKQIAIFNKMQQQQHPPRPADDRHSKP